MRKLFLLALGWSLFLAAPWAHAATFPLTLTRSPEEVGSWYRPSDTASKFYDPGTTLTLELPSTDGTLAGVETGVARITDFSLPGTIDNFGLYFRFTSVPSLIEGTVTVSGSQAEIAFPDLSVDFERGTNPFDASPGTLVFTLTTAGTTIPGGCAGRLGDQLIPGIPLSLVNGRLGLVASVCPYSTAHAAYDDAFRLAVRGGLPVPECGDELDNDGDGFTDFSGGDPGCTDAGDLSERGPGLVCDDGADNDGDGLADYPSDPGCDDAFDDDERSPLIDCDDGTDNDLDTLSDYPADPGCDSPADLSERSPTLPCDDAEDNDGDGLSDYPNDPGCDAPDDLSEHSPLLTCDDGADNDGDGLSDHPSDPGCDTVYDDSEKSLLLICDDGVDNDGDLLIDFPQDPGCDDPLDPTETPTPVVLTKGQQACVNQMNKNGEKVNKAQLKEQETCLKDHQKGKLTTSFEECTTADRKGKVQKAADKTESGEEKKCDKLLPDEGLPAFGYTDASTVNLAAVNEALVLVDRLFGDPVQDADLATKDDKATAACQTAMLKQAGKLESAVVKAVNKAKKTALKDTATTSGEALETALAAVFGPANAKLLKLEDKLESGVGKKCSALSSPDTIFPGTCADADWNDVIDCAIAAARCQACRKINAFDGLGLDCEQLDNGNADASCP